MILATALVTSRPTLHTSSTLRIIIVCILHLLHHRSCQRIGPPMDVYVVGQRLLNFFDNQRINLFKQLVRIIREAHFTQVLE